jgi:hypothetical protein
MTHHRPPLLPPFTVKTAFDYLLIAASLAVGLAVLVRLLG